MKVLVIGGGGREHAIVHTLKKSPKVDHIWCAPGNGGIAAEAECVAIKATDIDGMVAFAKEHKPDLVMVACLLYTSISAVSPPISAQPA